MIPIGFPNEPLVRLISEDAILFCSNIACITSSPHIYFNVIRPPWLIERIQGKVLQKVAIRCRLLYCKTRANALNQYTAFADD